MGRVNDDNWLDKALDKAIHSDDTQPDFEQWMANHPEAVEMLTARTPQVQRPPLIRRILMNNMYVKLAAAAVIVIAAIAGIAQFTRHRPGEAPAIGPVAQETFTGPMTHTFADSSIVRLAEGASIRTYGEAGKRGFQHLAGEIDVTVAGGLGEFIVTTPYGDVKALGTQFTMELVDGIAANTKEPVKLLAVEVREGSVEVRNTKGAKTLKAMQDIVVQMDSAPYDFNQDETLPPALRDRIQAMADAFAAGDPAAWAANFNLNYLFKLIKGQVEYDPMLFGGSEADAKRLQENLGMVEDVEELSQQLLSGINITGPVNMYVQSVVLNEAGDHAQAECISRRSENAMTIIRPQWHYFDNDWWQIDD